MMIVEESGGHDRSGFEKTEASVSIIVMGEASSVSQLLHIKAGTPPAIDHS
jgi:hypothetical protein